MVDIVTTLLANRADAASILTAVALRISSSPPTPAPAHHYEQPGVQPAKPQPASAPPSVSVVKELSRADRDAALLKDAVDLSSSYKGQPPAVHASDGHSMESPASSVSSTAALITTTTIPSNLLSSPSIGAIKLVLDSSIDYTLKVWHSRAFYEPSAVAEYTRWSNPASPPHRDAPDALALLSNFDELGVPAALLSPHPDTAAVAWHHYRGLLRNALHRAFAAGVDWRRALRSLSLLYSAPDGGHPRIASYIGRAITDAALVLTPLLHADVLIYQLDVSFAHGSRQHGLHSHNADWDGAVSRLPGEDALTLAHRVVDAYVKKLGDSSVTSTNVWLSTFYTGEINERFELCLLNDVSLPERGRHSHSEFTRELTIRDGRVRRGEATRLELSCIDITECIIMPLEEARTRTQPYDLTNLTDLADLDDAASHVSTNTHSTNSHSRGQGHRARRAATRALR